MPQNGTQALHSIQIGKSVASTERSGHTAKADGTGEEIRLVALHRPVAEGVDE